MHFHNMLHRVLENGLIHKKSIQINMDYILVNSTEKCKWLLR